MSRMLGKAEDIKVLGICHLCRYLHADGLTCKAFPGGIPKSVSVGYVDHRMPVKGDGGIQFKGILPKTGG